MGLSQFDREHLAGIMVGEGDWFTAHLIRLIRKADPFNRALLRQGFPEEVAAVEEYESWKSA